MTELPSDARIAIVRRRDALHTVSGFDGMPQTLSVPGGTHWPSWIRGSNAVVASRSGRGSAAPLPRVVRLDASSGDETTVYQNRDGDPPMIAPNVPHYVFPSPDGARVAIVAATATGLSLFVRDTRDPSLDTDPILTNAPLFFDWSPDSRHLAIHAGNDFAVIEIATGERFAVVSGRAMGFRSPAYSSDGTLLAFGIFESTGMQLVIAAPDGTGRWPAATFDRSLTLAFRPGFHELTVGTLPDPNGAIHDALWTVDPRSHEKRVLYRGPFSAYCWAPSGDRLALLYPTQSGDGSYALYMLDPRGHVIAASPPFYPSHDQGIWLAFFDQYSRSHQCWLPGGEALLVCGRVGPDRMAPAFGDRYGSATLLWEGTPGAPFRDLGPGELAVTGFPNP